MGSRIRSWVSILPGVGIAFGRRAAGAQAVRSDDTVVGTGLGYREPIGAPWPAGGRR